MNQPRVILVKPPEVSEFDFGAFSLGVLAAYIREITEPVIVDATLQKSPKAVETVCSLQPEIIGITVMGLSSVNPALDFLRKLKYSPISKQVDIIIGGHGATGAPERFLEAGASAVVQGEGEQALISILKNGIEPGAPGIICQEGAVLITGPAPRMIQPLDRLPLPARDLMPAPRNGIHLMETSRGCPHQCAFCETTRFYRTSWRAHSPQRVATEAASLVDDWDAWTILFSDDNFAASPARVLEICERLSHGSLPATFMASVRADDLLWDPGIIPAMAAARIFRVTIGVETLEPEAAQASGKPIPGSIYGEAFDRLREHGIFSLASFIVGLPQQRFEPHDMVQAAVEAGPDAAVFVPFIPMPGTPLANGRRPFESNPIDRENARTMTSVFFQHDIVRQRLCEAEAAGGIRGLMAQGLLTRHGRR